MTDTDQGVPSTPDDASLFSDATSTTLEKFENEGQLPIPPVEAKQPEPPPPPPPPPVVEPVKPEAPEAPVPAGRLREEAEARRRAERERDELLRQLAAVRQTPPTPPQPTPKPDLFDNPSGFVQHEVRPYFEQIQQAMRMQTEAISEQTASTAYGADKVAAAKQALTEGMHRGDPNVRAVWEQAMQSPHPYDVITRWHRNNETMREIGGDTAAYRERIRKEALSDPDFLRQAIEASKGGARHVAQPVVTSSVPRIPSLGNIGAGGGEVEQAEPSDAQLFHSAVTARRK
jgi:hypothetical protein